METCALCGFRYEPKQKCSCPMVKSCTMACCPNCGYGMPAPSPWLQMLLVRLRRTAR